MVIDKNKAYKNLKKKGFTDSENKSDDHLYVDFYYDGKFVLYTKFSHGSTNDIGIKLIKQMAFQCKLTNHDFQDLANCPLSKEAYIKKLKDSGALD